MELRNVIELFEKVGGGKYTSIIFDGWCKRRNENKV